MSSLRTGSAISIVNAERNLTLEKAVRGDSLNVLIRRHGDKEVIKAITANLVFSSEYFNVSHKMSDGQALQIASLVIERYSNESLEDIMLCLKKAKLNEYGTTYNRIDGQIFFEWFQKYLDEKYEFVDQRKHQEKHLRMEEISDAFSGVATQLLTAINKRQAERLEDKEELIITSGNSHEKHMEYFKEVVRRATHEQLDELLKDYKKHQKLGNQDAEYYIQELNAEIENRTTT